LIERLGNNLHLNKLSIAEDAETVELEMLEELAHAFGVPVQLLKTNDDEKCDGKHSTTLPTLKTMRKSLAQGTSQTAEVNHN
jgi:hypothetical protein